MPTHAHTSRAILHPLLNLSLDCLAMPTSYPHMPTHQGPCCTLYLPHPFMPPHAQHYAPTVSHMPMQHNVAHIAHLCGMVARELSTHPHTPVLVHTHTNTQRTCAHTHTHTHTNMHTPNFSSFSTKHMLASYMEQINILKAMGIELGFKGLGRLGSCHLKEISLRLPPTSAVSLVNIVIFPDCR